MTFKLGLKSRFRLRGVHDDLVRVVERAVTLAEVDPTVLEGVRTPERQEKLFKAGASRTLKSRHLSGHAVDLGVLVDGKISWSWVLYLRLAPAMIMASRDLNVPLTWGGVWDRTTDQLDEHNLEGEIAAYTKRWHLANPFKGEGMGPQGPLLDGPHWELPRSTHP